MTPPDESVAEQVREWKEDNPWWWPTITDEEWAMRTRTMYPDDAHLSNEALRRKYADGMKYQTLWDHVGDAREEHERLADAFLQLVEFVDEEPTDGPT